MRRVHGLESGARCAEDDGEIVDSSSLTEFVKIVVDVLVDPAKMLFIVRTSVKRIEQTRAAESFGGFASWCLSMSLDGRTNYQPSKPVAIHTLEGAPGT